MRMCVSVFKETFLLFHLFKTIEVRLGILVELLGFYVEEKYLFLYNSDPFHLHIYQW